MKSYLLFHGDTMRLLLIVLLSWLANVCLASVHQFTLDNGLKILVKEDHRAKVAVVMVWYNVGSAYDPAGLTGISHVLEHLMFKGTKRYPIGEFSKIITSLGGQENAFTTADTTAYFEKIAVQHVPTSLRLEADRMQHLNLDSNEFAKEIQVIQEERRQRIENNPQALAFERFTAAAHLSAPYQHPVIGWMNDLKTLRLNEVKSWYQKRYAPNQATVVVVGDVEPKVIYSLVKGEFGKLKRSPELLERKDKEPPPLGKKTVEIHGKTQVPMSIRGYLVPSIKSMQPSKSEDPYVLDIIATLLDAGDNGRLQQSLVRKTLLASQISVYYNPYTRFETQFTIFAAPTAQTTIQALDAQITTEINRLKTELVPDIELKRIKTQIIAQKTFERDSLIGQASELGLLETIGLGWDMMNQYEAHIERITPQEVLSVANTYFQESRQTNATLIPQHKDIP